MTRQNIQSILLNVFPLLLNSRNCIQIDGQAVSLAIESEHLVISLGVNALERKVQIIAAIKNFGLYDFSEAFLFSGIKNEMKLLLFYSMIN